MLPESSLLHSYKLLLFIIEGGINKKEELDIKLEERREGNDEEEIDIKESDDELYL